MMAIVSKAVFEKDAPAARPGVVLPLRRYQSSNKALARLDGKSRLFLVTVRPPAEALWLVAVLEELEFDGERWNAAKNRYPVTELLPSVREQLKFDTGKGLFAKPGALGMSLQTPRVLTAADAELLLQAAGAPLPRKGSGAAGPIHLAVHEVGGPLPCLCRKCLDQAPETIAYAGGEYFRAEAAAHGRRLWFWVPAELRGELPAVIDSVAARLQSSLKPLAPPTPTK